MKHSLLILMILLSLRSIGQDKLSFNAYNNGIFCSTLNGSNYKNTPIKNIQTNVRNWIFIRSEQPEIVEYIELSFLERAFRSTEFVININNNVDTLTIDQRNWKVEISDTLKLFSLNTVGNVSSPTIDSIRVFKDGIVVELQINYKSKIDDSGVAQYHDQMKGQLMRSKSKEYRLTKKFYEKNIKKLIIQERQSEVDKILSEYHENPTCELSKITLSAADQLEGLASDYISGNKYSKWSRNKRIRKGKIEYLKSAKLYRKAHLLSCTEGNSLIYKAVAAYNQAEKFDKAKELLKPFILNSQFDSQFFDYYFMTRNKVSRAKELRENGFLYYSCGGSPDVIDSEHYYSKIVLRNSAILYKEKKYELLLEYLKKSRIRINWSWDVRLNRINNVLCQMLIKSLEQKYSKTEILAEFEQAKIYTEEFDYFGAGDSMNLPKGTLKIFEIPLKLYDSNSTRTKYSKEKNEKPLIDFVRQNENMKEKTILGELLSIIE